MSLSVGIESNRGVKIKKIFLEKLGWLVYILILGMFSSGLLMGASYLIPVDDETLNLETRMLILKALDLEHSPEIAEQVYRDNITMEEIDDLTLYHSSDGSIAFMFTGRGHQNLVSGIIALESDLKSMKGLVILQQQETPGLGGRITEEEFLAQFRGLAVDPQLVILPAGGTVSADNEIQGITGATMTSQALEKMLMQSISNIRQKLEGN
ncbi:MAG: FMN-binding protein [Dethiobacteria bacterium]|nr:FMN-binding protein [Bacillota bacterium]